MIAIYDNLLQSKTARQTTKTKHDEKVKAIKRLIISLDAISVCLSVNAIVSCKAYKCDYMIVKRLLFVSEQSFFVHFPSIFT